jgi:PHD/YefM family antitoxin component YafN of YafNO toxin-antitoxin module
MKTVTVSQFLKKADLYLTMVPLAIKVAGGKKFVIVDASEYRSMSETLHLTSTVANTEHLMKSIKQAKGKS